ncbi:short-chain dehydrogenase [Desulfosarcina alkanivorans]|jgi:short-subunit dehydrogenase|uniref:Short-chain dehydrogenase n=1 Tax=Desulfosarcina alkanivorans TaxID=571177 RepID=A0A5K7YIG6_9BACT|nr:SDR family oxidoreductase [Desulfosarcina alkanivorans]BBO66204.1 short-chain dehydrogenase [Desulfosarcina alkanivorans]
MNLLILGGNSDVAYALARLFAERAGAGIVLASRNLELLDKKAKDLEIRYNQSVRAVYFDAADTDTHREFYDSLNPKPDGVVAAFGYLGDQGRAQSDFQEAQQIIQTNFIGAVSILEIVAADFEKRGQGVIVGMGSVAGERGRQNNYIYGAAKGAFNIYLSGLRSRLSKRRVHVMTVLPGFMDTKMTRKMKLPGLLTATPEQAAADIFNAFNNSKEVVYTRWFWRWIMAVIKVIPESIFKRLSL